MLTGPEASLIGVTQRQKSELLLGTHRERSTALLTLLFLGKVPDLSTSLYKITFAFAVQTLHERAYERWWTQLQTFMGQACSQAVEHALHSA